MIHIVLSHCTPLSPSAVAFKNAKQFDQAKEAYLKEAEYHTENKAYPFLFSFFSAHTPGVSNFYSTSNCQRMMTLFI